MIGFATFVFTSLLMATSFAAIVDGGAESRGGFELSSTVTAFQATVNGKILIMILNYVNVYAKFVFSFDRTADTPEVAATNFRHVDAMGNQVGSYAYINPEGKQVQVAYVADSLGFR